MRFLSIHIFWALPSSMARLGVCRVSKKRKNKNQIQILFFIFWPRCPRGVFHDSYMEGHGWGGLWTLEKKKKLKPNSNSFFLFFGRVAACPRNGCLP
jgi:hypothetical protein